MWIKVWNEKGIYAGIFFVRTRNELTRMSEIYPKWEYTI